MSSVECGAVDGLLERRKGVPRHVIFCSINRSPFRWKNPRPFAPPPLSPPPSQHVICFVLGYCRPAVCFFQLCVSTKRQRGARPEGV